MCVTVANVAAHVAWFLTREDALAWLVAAVEARATSLVRQIRYESAFRLTRADEVHAAVAFGRFGAVARLLGAAPKDEPTARKLVSSAWQRKFPATVLLDAIARIVDPDELLHTVQWLHPRTQYEPTSAVQAAARRRQLLVAQWIADAAPDERLQVLVRVDTAVQVLHWLEKSRRSDGGVLVHSWLATRAHGCAPMVKMYSYDAMPVPLYPAMDWAAEQGDLELLQALHDDHRVAWPCSTRAMDAAAARGDMAMVQWLHINRSEGCSSAAMDGAASNGHADVVKWLYFLREERGTREAFNGAAMNGHLKVLQWQIMKFPHFEISQSALETAASRGHVGVLQWVEETKQRVRVSAAIMESAINGGHLATAQWLVDKERAQHRDPRRLLRPHRLAPAASAPRNLAVLQWLWRDFHVANAAWLAVAVEHACVDTVEWLLRDKVVGPDEMVLGHNTISTLAERSHWSMLEWLLISHPDWCLACAFLPSNVELLASRSTCHMEDPAPWLARYTRLVLRHIPTIILSVDHATIQQLARWAAYHALDDVVLRLWELVPDVVSCKSLVDTLVARTGASPSAGRVVTAVVSDHPQWISRRVIQWAATYAHVALLDSLLHHTPSAQRFALLRTTAFTAARHGHAVVLTLARRQEPLLEKTHPDLWHGLALVAATHDQHDALDDVHCEGLA